MGIGYAPGRPPNERDLMQALSGMPLFVGRLESSGERVNNHTTAVPFFDEKKGESGEGTLAGMVLIIQAVGGDILILPGDERDVLTISVQSAPASFDPPVSMPGLLVANKERVILTMGQTTGFLQMMSVSGTASAICFALV